MIRDINQVAGVLDISLTLNLSLPPGLGTALFFHMGGRRQPLAEDALRAHFNSIACSMGDI